MRRMRKRQDEEYRRLRTRSEEEDDVAGATRKRRRKTEFDPGVEETSVRSTMKRLTRNGDGGVEDRTGARNGVGKAKRITGEEMRTRGEAGVRT